MGESPAKDWCAQNDLSDSFWEDIQKYTISYCKMVRSEPWLLFREILHWDKFAS